MHTLSVTLRYRPLRIGWCIANGDVAGFRSAVRQSFTMWGGRYNPIIPVDDAETAEQLVRLYRVDMLIDISGPPKLLSRRTSICNRVTAPMFPLHEASKVNVGAVTVFRHRVLRAYSVARVIPASLRSRKRRSGSLPTRLSASR